MRTIRPLLLISLSLGIPLLAAAADTAADADSLTANSQARRTLRPLIDKVQRYNGQFWDVNFARRQGWVEATPCVSGPNEGAMGVHFLKPPATPQDVNPVADGILDGARPEALIYEPVGNGWLRLVGVEFIQLADDWKKRNPTGGVPTVEGHLMNLVGEPNRYGLPAFYELHVWAFERNPKGAFADFNTSVKCDRQLPPSVM
jgi:hypothetical protein